MKDHGSSVAKADSGDAKSELHTVRWTCQEYGSPRGTFFIRNEAGESIAQSLKCGPERAHLMADAPELLQLARQAWGALNFILAFYEPGQTYLDTNAWTQAEASGRLVHAALREKLDAIAAKATAERS